MKIKLNPTQAQKKMVAQRRDEIALVRDAVLAKDFRLTKLNEQHSQYADQIATLEASADANDEAAMLRLAKARESLKITENSLQTAHSVTITGSDEARELGQLLGTTRDEVIYPTLAPALDSLIAEITVAVRPYVRAGGWAKDFAQRTDAASTFSHYIGRSFGNEPSIVESNRAISLCNAILKGELDVPFETD